MISYACELANPQGFENLEGFEWQPIGTIAGAGNSSTTLNYSFVDNNPYPGINYYRLKQTDYGGNYEYSNIIAVEMKKETNQIVSNIYPNPANKQFTFTYQGDGNSDLEIIIYNAMAQRIMELQFQEALPLSQYTVKINGLLPGVYWIQFFEKGYRQQTHKLSIVK